MNPYRVLRFNVEKLGAEIGGFSQITGLERSTTFEDYREGGINGYTHKLATVTKYPNLTLRRGVTDAIDFWAWHQAVIEGFVSRAEISVVLRHQDGSEAVRWFFDDAYPVKWNGTDLDAIGNTVAVESVELVHNGMRRL